MNDSTPPENGEPSSRLETAKNWCRKHDPKIRAVIRGGVTLAGMLVVAHLAAGRDDAETYDEQYDAEDSGESEQGADQGDERETRDSPAPHLRKLHPGHKASDEKKAQYRAEKGEDLPPGTTYVHPKDDEDPGEAAA
ncbi:hypothetical protein [Streptomyces sp. C]|uniref:hypothetical protein n=1 Tax=Streptomyces sp. C TaxID=253839 RepID=UPI0001B56303|nr:hypothetical protein [Streptomyces sp. C]